MSCGQVLYAPRQSRTGVTRKTRKRVWIAVTCVAAFALIRATQLMLDQMADDAMVAQADRHATARFSHRAMTPESESAVF